MAKTFKTYDDLIEFLKINKKLVISDEEKAKHKSIHVLSFFRNLWRITKRIFNNSKL